MPRCQALVEGGAFVRSKIETAQRCQNRGLAVIADVWLCGTHINRIGERPIEVAIMLEAPEGS